MDTTWRCGRLIVGMMLAGTLAGIGSGCVSSERYELTRREAEHARLLYENEQRRAQELAASNQQLKRKLQELEGRLQNEREKLERSVAEYRETRDELFRLNLDRQRQSARVKDRLQETQRQPEKQPDRHLESKPSSDASSLRLRESIQEIQTLLRQF